MEIPTARHEPIATIGQIPFLAGSIVVRNHLRIVRQRRKAQRWQRFFNLFSQRPDRSLVTWRRYNLGIGALTYGRAS